MEDAVAALFEAARRNEKSAPRKHHLIPASYLRRWAVDDLIRVTETDSHKTYLTSPEKAARETDFYRITADDLDPEEMPPLLFETMLSQVEGDAKRCIDLLLAGGPRALDMKDSIAFATFLAFQVTRGRAFRARLLDGMNRVLFLTFQNLTDAGIAQKVRERHGGEEPSAEEVANVRSFIEDWRAGKWRVGPQQAAAIAQAGEDAQKMAFYFLGRPWKVYESRLPLVTCDEPVVPIHGPRGRPRAEAGVGAAGVIVLPLDPQHLLAMFHPKLVVSEDGLEPSLLPNEADEINLFVAAHSHFWMFEQPNLTRTTTLFVPPLPDEQIVMPTVARRTGPESGRIEELRHVSSPNRWSKGFGNPTPPVERWWTFARQPGDHDRPYNWEDEEIPLYGLYG